MSGSSTRGAMRLAALLMIAGFVLMALAWNGAAEVGSVARQLPFLLSGTFPGLGLVVLGAVIALVIEFRRASSEMAARVEAAMESAGGAGTAGGLTAVPTDGTAVVAGRTTYHSPDCRLVEGRSDMQVMSPADAVGRGLAPCRICEPADTRPSAPAVDLAPPPAQDTPPPTVKKVEAPRTRAKKAARKRTKKAAKKRAKKSA